MEQARKNLEDIREIKISLALGYITYDEAKKEAKPIIERINKRGREIAKKYNKNYYDLTFSEIMR